MQSLHCHDQDLHLSQQLEYSFVWLYLPKNAGRHTSLVEFLILQSCPTSSNYDSHQPMLSDTAFLYHTTHLLLYSKGRESYHSCIQPQSSAYTVPIQWKVSALSYVFCRSVFHLLGQTSVDKPCQLMTYHENNSSRRKALSHNFAPVTLTDPFALTL